MAAPLGLNRSYPSLHPDVPLPGKRVSAALTSYRDQGKGLLAGFLRRSRDARPGSAFATLRRAKLAVTAVASEHKIIWVRPDDIVFKIRSDHDLHANDILAGDWDLNRAWVVDTIKYQSICKHFKDGVAWEDTRLFAHYAKRFHRGEVVRGASSLQRLKRQYETRVEGVFRDIGATGFRIARDLFGRPTNLPHVHIGRGGEVLYGTKGNHRLAMAKLLSLGLIPCHVRVRHSEWQKVREAVLDAVALTKHGAPPQSTHAAFTGHPDLADLYFPNE
jgi:hypothetical protein